MSTGLSRTPPVADKQDVNGDAELVAACLRDEAGAWERLVDHVGGTVAAAVRRVLGIGGSPAPGDVDDCVAEVMAVLVANDRAVLRGYRGDSKLTTWLYVIARRTALAWRKRATRQPRPGAVPEGPDWRPGPGEVAARQEAAERLLAALADLAERDREVLRRFYIEGQSGAAVGEALGIPARQVSVVLHRARERVRNLLS